MNWLIELFMLLAVVVAIGIYIGYGDDK